jgi:alkylhydroperoxidase/carboxymuconolactone decarboxylase family protein YurZ
MQTYEIAPDESMEMLVRTLSRMVRRDKDLVLVIPAGVNPFTGVESVTKLKGVMRSYDARLQVQAADPAVAALFQEAGIPVSPLAAQAPAPPAPQAAAPRPPAGPLPFPAPANPPQPPVQHFVPSGQSAPPEGPAWPGPDSNLPADIANMNFDLEDVGQPSHTNPAPYVPAPPQKGGFLQKLMGRSTPPAEPAPERPRPNADQPLPQPDWAQSGDGPESADLFGEGPTGLDVTMPEWLRDAPPEAPAAGNRIVGRLPTSNLDVTMPQIGGNEPSAGPGTGDLGVPSWLAEYGQSNPPPAPKEAQAPSAPSAMPAWLAEEAGAGPTASVDTGGDLGGLPEWLRDETPVAPPIQPGPYSAPAPTWPAANAAQGAASPAAPPPAPSAPTAAPAQPNAGAGLGGPEQTPESIAQAVRAAGLDARTRALLIFGMALVRLAPGEAAAGAAAARQAGCSKEELQLVVEMAQALGGGPSERLGRKVLGS